MIYDILQELKADTSTNYKLSVLEKYQDNSTFVRVLKMAYDKVSYNFQIRKIPEYSNENTNTSLEQALDFLEFTLAERKITGNKASEALCDVLSSLSETNAEVINLILDRDLKIGLNKTSINKVFSDLISKPVYQRCDTYRETGIDKKTKKLKKGTADNIKYPALLTLKADGTYREAFVQELKVEFLSRSGEEYFYKGLSEELMKLPSNRRYFGELTVELNDELLAKIIDDINKDNPETADKILDDYKKGIKTLPRAIGNGLLNSDNVPDENIRMDIWEYVTEEEYQNAKRKIKNTSKHIDRFLELKELLKDFKHLRIIPHAVVNSKQEALMKVSEWMTLGLEGGVLKNLSMVYRDGTNSEQLKMKLEISVEVRCIGFLEGKKGTKREKTFGSMIFENDEKTIRGRCSGFSDKDLEKINKNRDYYIGKVIEVLCNDITKAQGNDFYALSHPRFVEVRTDKTETDSLEKALNAKQSSMDLKTEI